jgi:hypothetical protein
LENHFHGAAHLETVLLCVEEDCNRLGHNLLLGESEKFGDITKVVVEFGF